MAEHVKYVFFSGITLSIRSICISFQVFLIFLLFNTSSFSQGGCAVIGGPVVDYGNAIINTRDGGYAIAGTTESFGAGFEDVYIIKLDSNAAVQWTMTVGGTSLDEGYAIIQTKDNGYAIIGWTADTLSNYDVYVVKLDSNGNLQWTKKIGGPNTEKGFSLIQCNDGAYAITGFTTSFGAGYNDVYVVKLDNLGNLEWTRTFGKASTDYGYSILEDKSNNLLISGIGTIKDTGGIDHNAILIIKIDSSGTLIWDKHIYGTNREETFSLSSCYDGGYIITGESGFGGGNDNVYVVKFDSLFNIKWTRTVRTLSTIEGGYSIIQTADGGFAVAAYTALGIAAQAYILKFDSIGNLEWTKIYGGQYGGGAGSIVQRRDGNYMTVGGSASFSDTTSNTDVFIVKVTAGGDVCCPMGEYGIVDSGGIIDSGGVIVSTGGVIASGGVMGPGGGIMNIVCGSFVSDEEEIKQEKIYFTISPNPSNGIFTVTGPLPLDEVEVFNVFGESNCSIMVKNLIKKTGLDYSLYSANFNLSFLPAGIYFAIVKEITQDRGEKKRYDSYAKIVVIK